MKPTVENFRHSDLSALIPLQPEGWPDFAPMFEFYLQSNFCFPIKIVISNQMVGIGSVIFHKHTAWLAHIVVHHEFRNQGIGALITNSLIDIAQKKNYRTFFLIATKMGEPVYLKCGFEKETEYVGFRQEKNLDASVNATPYDEQFKKEIFEMDREISGEDRSVLLTPHLKDTKVIIERNEVAGFYMPTLGEGLIFAKSPAAGKILLSLKHSTPNKVVIPVDNIAAYEFLLQNQFIETLRGTRMRLGDKVNYHPEHMYGRIGGYLG